MEQKLIPAPIDEKNITTDWIEGIFDFDDCVYNGKNTYTGFVNGSVCSCMYDNNRIIWQINKDYSNSAKDSYDELLKRLKECDDDASVVVKYDTSLPLFLMQSFYFVDE